MNRKRLYLSALFLWSVTVGSAFQSRSFRRRPGSFRHYPHVVCKSVDQAAIGSSDAVADRLGVQRGSSAPRILWKYSWRLLGWLLPILHLWDRARSRDLDYSLKCLWCKALTGLNRKSPVYDEGFAYDLLPSGTRRILKLPQFLFPRLIHFNIELRTTYLDQAVHHILKEKKDTEKIRLITLGAGYDTRSTRFLSQGRVDQAYELDVEPVIRSKRIMLDRLQKRRPGTRVPELLIQDLNDLDGFKQWLEGVTQDTSNSTSSWYTIFLFEGVMIYLRKDTPSKLLSCCSSSIRNHNGSLVFADLFRELPSVETPEAIKWFRMNGWELGDGSSWCVKPVLARHMGAAKVRKD